MQSYRLFFKKHTLLHHFYIIIWEGRNYVEIGVKKFGVLGKLK